MYDALLTFLSVAWGSSYGSSWNMIIVSNHSVQIHKNTRREESAQLNKAELETQYYELPFDT